MCGIVGYIGHREAYPIVLKGLHRLEYRGYDSAGIALFDGKELNLCKTKGKVADLEAKFNATTSTSGNVGIGHTRWATHGVPNDVNSHPHYSNSGNLEVTKPKTMRLLASLCQILAKGLKSPARSLSYSKNNPL